ncbi:S8 family serine peptidase [Henriciella sp. AS95]|uniref:S8 family serine peptidase n=1 Tax=Henriciella sp. AS95 TaxID=3135782 RepID=UPI00316D43C7
MAISPFLSRLGALCAGTMLAMIPAAHAQLLPGLADSLEQTVRDVERTVEDLVTEQIGNGLDDTLEPVGELLEGLPIVDGIGEVATSVDVGNTLVDTLQIIALDDTLGRTIGLVDNLTTAIPGISRLPINVRGARPIELDLDQGWPVVRNEWVVLVPSARAGDVEDLGVDIVERTDLSGADETLFVVSLTSDTPTAEAIEAKLASLDASPSDRNHVFRGASEPSDLASDIARRMSSTTNVDAPSPDALRIGLIDTDVDETHPALQNITLYEADFVSMGEFRPQTHGTAVASILAANNAKSPEARHELLAASAFFLSSDGTTGATSASLIEAIDWLQANGAAVINVSLTGPPNRALEAIIQSRQDAGTVFVAAVGNEGPASGPLYPAAYDGVVGVTAVDAKGKIYRWANRGSFVDVASLGVDVPVAKPGGMATRDSGTSFAAPIVTAFLGGWTNARRLEPGAADSLIQASVRSRPKGGRDDIYGYGILSPTR